MLKYGPYSFSRLNTHIQCPRKFKYAYASEEKIPQKKTDMTALFKGSALHSSLEHYPNPGTHKLSPKYQPIIEKFLKSKYKYYLDIPHLSEVGIGLNDKLEPVKYSKDAMFRGYVDYLSVISDENETKMILADWKSGGMREQRFQDYHQLMFYGIYMFKKYSKIDKIEVKYVYIEHNAENSLTLQRKYFEIYSKTLLDLINSAENSNFEKKETKLCSYCVFEDYCKADVD